MDPVQNEYPIPLPIRAFAARGQVFVETAVDWGRIMVEVLVYKADHGARDGERTYGWVIDTDYTFEISPWSHPDSNYIDDDWSVDYAQIGDAAFATQSRYDEPDSFINSMRLAISSGDGFAYQLTDETGTDFYSPIRFHSFAGQAVFLAVNPRADTTLAGGEALMVTDGVSTPRLLIDEPLWEFWVLSNSIWARESSRGDRYDLHRIDTDFNVSKVYDWDGESNVLETIAVFELGNAVYQFAWRGGEQEFFRYEANTGTFDDLNIVDYRGTFVGNTSSHFFYWDNQQIQGEWTGTELWVSDGTSTSLLRDLRPGDASSYPNDRLAANHAIVGDRMFFWARDAAEIDGVELFVTDGTPDGTLQLTGTGRPSGNLGGDTRAVGFWEIVALDDARALIVTTGAQGTELHVSDGTVGGTTLLADLQPGEPGAEPVIYDVHDGRAYFSIGSGPDDELMWVTDGTAAGTYPIPDHRPEGAGARPQMAEVIELDMAALAPRRIAGSLDGENIFGTIAAEIFDGREGWDWITPGGGNDTVDGGDGNDMVSFSDLGETPGRTNLDYRLTIDLEAGTAVSHDGAERMSLLNLERVTGTIFADFIRGDAGANQLRGLGDYDWFLATTGPDTIDGGNGQDMISFVEWRNAAANTIGDAFGPLPPSGAQATGIYLDLTNPANNTNLAAGLELTSIERITGSGRQDVFFGDDQSNDFRGLGDFDWFVGSDGGRERYFGGDGDDTVTYFNAPGAVTASLRNGAVVDGQQTGYGSQGWAARDLYFEIENLVGSAFDDRLTGSEARNQLNGLGGDDFLFGYGGIDYLKGGLGDDTINGGAGSDYALFDGDRASYTLTRSSGTEVTVSGPDGTDSLTNVEYFRFDDMDVTIWDLAIV